MYFSHFNVWLKGQLIIKWSAKVFILIYSLYCLISNNHRGDDCKILVMARVLAMLMFDKEDLNHSDTCMVL